MQTKTYVIGHVNPDTDSIASAMGYAWLLHERDGVDTVAARAGAINPQSAWVLKQLKLEAPVLLTDASPRFESVMQRLDSIHPDSQLGKAWTLASRTGGVAPVVGEDGKPYGIVNGFSLFRYFADTLGPRPGDTTVREMMSAPCKDAADTDVPKYPANGHIRDFLNRILRDEDDDYWVIDENGLYLGIARQRDILNPPRLKIILVDHNELSQAVQGADEVEIIEIIDHHRLGSMATQQPILFRNEPVGSTCTIVADCFFRHGVEMPRAIAGLMLAGVVSDTLNLTSPTTTTRDMEILKKLEELSQVNAREFTEKLFASGSLLTLKPAPQAITTDCKEYAEAGVKFSVAQIEEIGFEQFWKRKEEILGALENYRAGRAYLFSTLLVTDVTTQCSLLLVVGDEKFIRRIDHPRLEPGIYELRDVVSRKKQLLPYLTHCLREKEKGVKG